MPSSVIYGMRYDPQGRVLEVVFRGSGEVYQYFGVPAEVWRAFVRAPSKGTFLNTVFKDGGYGYEKVKGFGLSVAAVARTGNGGAEVSRWAFRDVPDGNVWGFYE